MHQLHRHASAASSSNNRSNDAQATANDANLSLLNAEPLSNINGVPDVVIKFAWLF